jgi:hypothetical protein
VRKIILDEPGEASVARRPIRVEVSTAADGSAVELRAHVGDARVGRSAAARPLVELADVAERTVLRVLPAGGGVFPDGTLVTLVVSTSPTPRGTQDTVTVRGMDVSRREFRDLALVEPLDEQRLRVRRLVGADVPLGPVATQARAAARGVLGYDGRDDPLDVVVAVDMSASMVAATADGSVALAVDTVVGVAQVLGPGRTPAVYLLGRDPDPVDPVAPGEIAAATGAALSQAGRGSGFRSVACGPVAGPGALVYVITDDIPADVDLLAAAGGPARLRRIVLVDAASASPGPAGGVPVPVAVLPAPRPGTTAQEHLAHSAHAMAALVAPMVAGFERAGAVR